MKIKTIIQMNSVMTNAHKNVFDSDSGSALADTLDDKIKELNIAVKARKIFDSFGELEFLIRPAKFAVDSDKFTVEFEAIAEYESNKTTTEIWDKFSELKGWSEWLSKYISDIIIDINSKLLMYVPYNESFMYNGEHFWIEMDPIEPYTPEFTKFSIDTEVDPTVLEEELIVI